ncbi:uncharacterized protein LOC115621915 [Scaptodrosophila lebanonensis]|uniref:Uncharacterized protein LOC115621915 n=1 Tax=Drosophila lebanonensis TaxID=7225 RepID=A0A6J2T3Y6_DROLE|nr:uncharacterized protein LOC115621915 [Scaptodrosophila lebanonensis]
MRHSRRHLPHHFTLMAVALLLKFGESADVASYDGDHYYSNASMKLLRFRDFEPRQQSAKIEVREGAGGREARGFHFHSSGDDVSVELEFIVPFFKVPVKRSMSMARDTLRNILNLQTGALINTVVVVAGGAIVAAVVRLLLGSVVLTPYGYGAKWHSSLTVRRLTSAVESQLDEHQIDMPACAQRYICQYLQRNAAAVRRRDPTAASHAKLIHALANFQWLDTFLNGTAVFNAIGSARASSDCGRIFRSCRWSQVNLGWMRAMPRFFQYFNG